MSGAKRAEGSNKLGMKLGCEVGKVLRVTIGFKTLGTKSTGFRFALRLLQQKRNVCAKRGSKSSGVKKAHWFGSFYDTEMFQTNVGLYGWYGLEGSKRLARRVSSIICSCEA